MLERLQFDNFKSWQHVDLEFGRITGLFGANSSGKTSITQFILLLKQTKEATDRALVLNYGGDNSLVNLGSFSEIVYKHDLARTISWKLEWSLPNILTISDPEEKRTAILVEGDHIAMEGRVAVRRGTPSGRLLSYSLGDREFRLIAKNDEAEFKLEPSTDDRGFRFQRNPGRQWNLPGPVKSYIFPDQAKTYYQNSSFLADFEAAFEQLMDSIYYLGPLRDYPKRQYTWSGAKPTDVGRRGENFVDAFLAMRASGKKQNLSKGAHYRTFDEIIAYWLKELGLIYDFRIDEIKSGSNLYQVWVKRSKGSEETLLTDVGFGVSQILPVIVLLWYVDEGSTVILEQPEIHLHPMVQAGLADVIIAAATHRRVQVILESHSEHLLRRLQRRIAEGHIKSEQTRFYFCEAAGSGSKLIPLIVDESGHILNWPKQFFGDEFGELAAMEKAAISRRRSR